MKICIIATHSFPIPYKTYTGDNFIKELVKCLDRMGHEVTFVAPYGSYTPSRGKNIYMPCSYGKYPPSSDQCEIECFWKNKDELLDHDIIHDFSITKRITYELNKIGFKNTVLTQLGGDFRFINHLTKNVILSSHSFASRIACGYSDYHGTDYEYMANNHNKVIKARVVNYGCDTDFYYPVLDKDDYVLWLGRWHIIRGYDKAIEVAKKTGIKLVMAGLDPQYEMFDEQKKCCLEAQELAKDCSNISFEFLPEVDHHEKKRKLIQNAKALLLPTQFQEPFGITMIEALSCGTPVITTSYGAMPEIITEDVGIIYDNTIEQFERAIKNIKKIKPYKCRDRAITKYTSDIMAKNYLKCYNDIIRGDEWK